METDALNKTHQRGIGSIDADNDSKITLKNVSNSKQNNISISSATNLNSFSTFNTPRRQVTPKQPSTVKVNLNLVDSDATKLDSSR